MMLMKEVFSIQRDIESIRDFLHHKVEKEGVHNSVIYDSLEKGYRLECTPGMMLNNSEILAICKILLDSRAFTKVEMKEILMKLIHRCIPKSNRKLVMHLINYESIIIKNIFIFIIDIKYYVYYANGNTY